MDNIWRWENWEGLPYLTCSLLPDFKHGFFTKAFYPRSPEDMVRVLDPSAKVYRVKQVHGKDVLFPKQIKTQKEADGIISDRDKQAVWVASADCTPVLIGDVSTFGVAAVHAGWRGTAKTIVPEAIRNFIDRGSSLNNLRIAMGPAISGKVYQVSTEVAAEVGQSIFEGAAEVGQSIFEGKDVLKRMWEIEESPLSEDRQPDKVRIDIRRVNEIQLEKLGIKKEHIAIAPMCTFGQPEFFFSYRRTKVSKVQWSGIVSGDVR